MRLLVICVTGFAGLGVFAAETKLKTEQLPPAVQAAIKRQTHGATILGASEEREHGRMTYEVETTLDGKSRDLTFDGNGTLLEVEQEMDLDSIPEPAREAIRKKLFGGTIKKVESVTQGLNTSYEAAVKMKNGKSHEVSVNADGSSHKEN